MGADPLTEMERGRFATWLECEAATDDAVAEQLEVESIKQNGHGGRPLGDVAHMVRMMASAKRLIAREIRAMEPTGIGRAR